MRHAKSQCRPSSLEICLCAKVNPGSRFFVFSQKIAAKDPEKYIPSTAANATSLSPNVAVLFSIQARDQLAFCFSDFQLSELFLRSTSSTVQNDATAFFYIDQILLYSFGSSTKRLGFSFSIGSVRSDGSIAIRGWFQG